MSPLYLFIIVVFLAGLYFYATYGDGARESFVNGGVPASKCPNLLVQKGARFALLNTRVAQVPGVNPIEFDNLEEYTEFLDWQHSQGIHCPVLYLQQTYDAQGNPVYKVRPSVMEPSGGLPPSLARPPVSGSGSGSGLADPNPTLLVDATQSDAPYNKNSYPAFDPSSQYVGSTTPLDRMNQEQQAQPVSPDPMDPNWGGAAFTQNLVDQGVYKENEVQIYVP
jgi:hypothetical protein